MQTAPHPKITMRANRVAIKRQTADSERPASARLHVPVRR